MGQKIWGMLAEYEGRWVAVDKQGKVAAHAGSLHDIVRLAGDAAHRMTFLYAAPNAPDGQIVKSFPR